MPPLPLCQAAHLSFSMFLEHNAHSSLGTGHPGANSTLSLLKDYFWWPSMARDVKRFVQCCPDLRHLQKPLPTTNWQTPASARSQPPMVIPTLGVDFITYLLPSDGNTCIQHSRITADLQQSEAPSYHPGQKVWPSTRDIRLKLPCKKFSPRYITSPFTIIRQINPVMYQLQLPSHYRIQSSGFRNIHITKG